MKRMHSRLVTIAAWISIAGSCPAQAQESGAFSQVKLREILNSDQAILPNEADLKLNQRWNCSTYAMDFKSPWIVGEIRKFLKQNSFEDLLFVSGDQKNHYVNSISESITLYHLDPGTRSLYGDMSSRRKARTNSVEVYSFIRLYTGKGRTATLIREEAVSNNSVTSRNSPNSVVAPQYSRAQRYQQCIIEGDLKQIVDKRCGESSFQLLQSQSKNHRSRVLWALDDKKAGRKPPRMQVGEPPLNLENERNAYHKWASELGCPNA